jgi:hypothetical protein
MRYKIVGGYLDLEEAPEQTAAIPIPVTTNPLYDKRDPHIHGTVWYKSKSDSKLVNVPYGFEWSPVKKPTTLHTYTHS